MSSDYDVAQFCTNGHLINKWSISYPESNQKFCEICGAPTIICCPQCNHQIRGASREGMHFGPIKTPKFCPNCGHAFPWTQSRLDAAQELAVELDNLNAQEREILIKSLDDLVKDTPQTQVAILRFKKLMLKIGTAGAQMFREVLVDVLSETAKKALYP